MSELWGSTLLHSELETEFHHPTPPSCTSLPLLPCRAYDSVTSSSQQTWDQAKAAAQDRWQATKDKTGEVSGH